MRQPLSNHYDNQFDAPLSWNQDETDVLVMCDKVLVLGKGYLLKMMQYKLERYTLKLLHTVMEIINLT